MPAAGSAALPPQTDPPLCGMLYEAKGFPFTSFFRKNGVKLPDQKDSVTFFNPHERHLIPF